MDYLLTALPPPMGLHLMRTLPLPALQLQLSEHQSALPLSPSQLLLMSSIDPQLASAPLTSPLSLTSLHAAALEPIGRAASRSAVSARRRSETSAASRSSRCFRFRVPSCRCRPKAWSYCSEQLRVGAPRAGWLGLPQWRAQ